MRGDIDAVWPVPQTGLSDQQLLRAYAPPRTPWLRMNFVSSLDGAATRGGRSGHLGDSADRRLFELLRWRADVVLLGAGTARVEGYGAMRLAEDATRWRVAHGLSAQPVFAVVSGALDLDPASPIFTQAPVTPIVFTVAEAPALRRSELAQVAEVVDVGRRTVDPAAIRAQLAERGLKRIHGEGGPTLFGTFLATGVVDELCLTLAPTLESGAAARIAHGAPTAPTEMELVGILRSGSELLLRYLRQDEGIAG